MAGPVYTSHRVIADDDDGQLPECETCDSWEEIREVVEAVVVNRAKRDRLLAHVDAAKAIHVTADDPRMRDEAGEL